MTQWCRPVDGDTALVGRSFGYSDNVNLTEFTDAATTGRSETLGYTAANWLNSAVGVWGR